MQPDRSVSHFMWNLPITKGNTKQRLRMAVEKRNVQFTKINVAALQGGVVLEKKSPLQICRNPRTWGDHTFGKLRIH